MALINLFTVSPQTRSFPQISTDLGASQMLRICCIWRISPIRKAIRQFVPSPQSYPSLPSTTTSFIPFCLGDVTYSTRAYLVPTRSRLC